MTDLVKYTLFVGCSIALPVLSLADLIRRHGEETGFCGPFHLLPRSHVDRLIKFHVGRSVSKILSRLAERQVFGAVMESVMNVTETCRGSD